MDELKKLLLNNGIDPGSLDVDFSKELGIEEMQEIHDVITDRAIDKNMNRNTSAEIDFYHPNAVSDKESSLSVEDAVNWLDDIEDEGLDLNPDWIDSGYKFGEGSAQKLYDEAANAFLDFAAEEITGKREGKIGFARALMEDEVNTDEALRWFEEKDSLEFSEFNRNLFPDTRNLGMGKNEKVYDQSIQQYWNEIKNLDIEDEEKLKRAALLDINKTLEGLVPNRDTEFEEKVQEFRDILYRFRPEEYGSRLEGDYTVNNIYGRTKITEVSRMLSTCLTRYESDTEDYVEDNLYSEIPIMYDDDSFTFLQAIGKDGALVGYTRSFLMKDSEDNYFLGLDTIEVPGVSDGIEQEDIKTHFEQYEDIVSAAALGTLKLGADLDVDYVAGRDAKVKFGPRQGFKNTSRNIQYEKVGDPVPYYSVADTVEEVEVERYLADTGKVEKWTYELEKRKPGFAVYHEPGEQEVRGFQTENRSHSTEVKLLMSFPEL